MKRMLTIVCALSLVALLVVPAQAEVQNIKIGGSIDIRGFLRDNYTTAGSGGGRAVTGFTNTNSRDWYNMVTKLAVEADLTDNVGANILLGNERDWGTAAAAGGGQGIVALASYITLKEMLYSPLTVKAGRFPLQVADGLVVGDGVTGETAAANVIATDYSMHHEWDAIMGVLDYDPMTLYVGVGKLADATQATTDDVDIFVIDSVYQMEDYKAVLDTYFANAHYSSPGNGATTGNTGALSSQGIDVYVLATRVTAEPADNIMAELGLAYQFGDYQKTAAVSRDLKAYAFNLGLDYAISADYSPKVGCKYIYRSGNKNTTGDYKGWLPLTENQVNGIIRDPNTNTSSFALTGSLVPLDRLTVGMDIWFYQLAQKQTATATRTTKKEDGTEVDLNLKYAYTEDVTMGLSFAYFMPGDYYATGNDKTAKQIMTELGVKF